MTCVGVLGRGDRRVRPADLGRLERPERREARLLARPVGAGRGLAAGRREAHAQPLPGEARVVDPGALELADGRPRRVDGRAVLRAAPQDAALRGEGAAAGVHGQPRGVEDAVRRARGDELLAAQARDGHVDRLEPLRVAAVLRPVRLERGHARAMPPLAAVERVEHLGLPVGLDLGLDPQQLAPVARPVERRVAVVPGVADGAAARDVLGDLLVVDPGSRAVEHRRRRRGRHGGDAARAAPRARSPARGSGRRAGRRAAGA